MPTEILALVANLALDLFTITSMLAVGMSLTVKEIIRPLRNLRQMLLILFASFVLLPLWALLLTWVLPLGDEQKTALILLGACAGGPFIPLLVQTVKGNMPLAAGAMVLLLVITIFFVPLVLPLMLPDVQVDAPTIARDLILFMLVPLIIGLLVRWRIPNQASRWQPNFSRFSMLSLLVMLFTGTIPALPKIINTLGTLLIPSAILLALGGWGIGYLLAFRQESRLRKVISLGTGQRNLAAALLVAAHSFSADTFVMTLVACLVLTLTMFLVAAEWIRRSSNTVPVDS
jgi:BASS family bile acid:Na+ symporter